jgi:hypothetical protein
LIDNSAGSVAVENIKITNNILRSCGFTTTAANKRGIAIIAGATAGTSIYYLSINDNVIVCDAPYGTVASYGITYSAGGSFYYTSGLNNVVALAGISPSLSQPAQYVFGVKQESPTAKTTAVTLTIAELLTGIITATHTAGATAAYTLPTGTDSESGASFSIRDSFDWSVINLSAAAADTITITANTTHTFAGNPIVQSANSTTGGIYGNSARFRTIKTSLNTFETYRIS